MVADTYSNTLGYLVMGTGNDNNSWGSNANAAVFQILEDAIANALTSTVTGGTLDLSGSPPPAAASQVRYAGLIFNGALGSNQIIQVPNLRKFWWVQNATSGAFTLKIKTPSGTASIAIPQNSGWQLVQCDGSNVITVSPFNSVQVQMPDGSAAAPAYSDINEPTSGWYRNGTQDWRLSINGTDVLQVTGTGAGTPSVFNIASPLSLQVGGVQVVPAGVEADYAGITAPTGWYFEYGQAVSRTTDANLLAAITATLTGDTHSNTSLTNLSADMRHLGLDGAFVEGTGIPTGTTITFTGATTATLSQAASSSTVGLALRILPYGQGDGSTTFNVPDRRDLVLAGRGDMGGTDRALITVAGGNFDGTRLNGTGGSQNHTNTLAEMVAHSHPGSTSPQTAATDGVGAIRGIADGTGAGGQEGGGSQDIYRSGQYVQIFVPQMTLSIASQGSGTAYSILPPLGISNKIIKR